MNTALVIVDVQNDFAHPDGSLYIKNAEEIYPAIDRLIQRAKLNDWAIILTKDNHPENHCSFKSNGGIWPNHCVQGTWGNEFSVDLGFILGQYGVDFIVVEKGEDPEAEQYSGVNKKMNSILEQHRISNVFVCGLATDYCVYATAYDFEDCTSVDIVIDACKHVSDSNLEKFMKDCADNYIGIETSNNVYVNHE